jgi:hypothetical protein
MKVNEHTTQRIEISYTVLLIAWQHQGKSPYSSVPVKVQTMHLPNTSRKF